MEQPEQTFEQSVRRRTCELLTSSNLIWRGLSQPSNVLMLYVVAESERRLDELIKQTQLDIDDQWRPSCHGRLFEHVRVFRVRNDSPEAHYSVRGRTALGAIVDNQCTLSTMMRSSLERALMTTSRVGHKNISELIINVPEPE